MNTYLLIVFAGAHGDGLLLGPVHAQARTWLDANFGPLNTRLQFGGLPLGYVVNPLTDTPTDLPRVTVETWLRRGLEVAEELGALPPDAAPTLDAELQAKRRLEHALLQAELGKTATLLRAALEDYLLLEKMA